MDNTNSPTIDSEYIKCVAAPASALVLATIFVMVAGTSYIVVPVLLALAGIAGGIFFARAGISEAKARLAQQPKISQTDYDEALGKVSAIDRVQAIIEFNLDGTIITANQNFLDAMGYRLEEIQGHHHSMFVAPDYKASAEYKNFWTKLNRGEFDAGEYPRVTKSGKKIWIQASYNPVFDDSGRPSKVIKFATDITQQKLQAANYEGQIAAIKKSQAVIEFNLDGIILDANKNFLATTGYTLEEIRGQHHSMFVAPAHAQSDEYRTFWQKLKRGEYESGEYMRLAKNAREIWIQASYNPIFDADGRPFKVVKYASDITAEKLKNANYSAQINAISKAQAVIEFNMDGTIITANANFLNTVGYALEEIQGKHHSLFAEPKFGRSQEYKEFWQKLNRGEYAAGEYHRLGKGGREIWIQASYNPIMDLRGRPYKVVKYATDITAQKKQAIKNASVRQALNNVTANVMIADERSNISYVNAALENMLSNAASDIRKEVAHFEPRDLVGKSADIFSSNARLRHENLNELGAPESDESVVGGRTFTCGISPIIVNGDRIGTVIEWHDKTAELAIEREIDELIDSAAAGDFSKQASLDGKDGFFLNLSKGLNTLNATIDDAMNDIVRVLEALAGGDLTESMTHDYQGALGRLKVSTNSTVAKLTEIISNIRSSASAISTASAEIAQGNNDLSSRTEQQAAALEETASSMEEMTSTVKQSASNASYANKLAVDAQERASQGGEVVSSAINAMQEISTSSEKIVNIIGVIDEIAFQTNLLALNAAVEAARAGEQGRGFAVVASEVRNLAQRSAAAAKEIKDLIQDSVTKVADGTRFVSESGETLHEIVGAVEKVVATIVDINSAAQEQAIGIEQVNKAISEMDGMTQQNAAMVEEASAAGAEMAQQARDMESMMSFFTTDAR